MGRRPSPAGRPATSAYTDFLLAVAALEPVGHIAAAMTPCMRLYAYLGQQLAAHNQTVRTEDGGAPALRAAVRALAQRLEALLDRYGGDDDRPAVLYHRAMELELRFFDAAADGRAMNADALLARPAAAWQAATVHPFLAV